MVSSHLSRDLEAPLRRLIKQDEIPCPHTRLDPVTARRDRPGVATSAWDTAANRRIGHSVSRVQLGAPSDSPRTAEAACGFSKEPASLAERAHRVFPAFSSSATRLCPFPFYPEPIRLSTFQAA